MIFAKITEHNTVSFCPRKGKSISHNTVHTNLPRFYEAHPDIAGADGYYEYIQSTIPEMQEGYYCVPSYTLTNNQILQSWTVSVLPTDEYVPT